MNSRTNATTSVLLALLLVGLLAACGDDQTKPGADAASSAATVTVDLDAGASAATTTSSPATDSAGVGGAGEAGAGAGGAPPDSRPPTASGKAPPPPPPATAKTGKPPTKTTADPITPPASATALPPPTPTVALDKPKPGSADEVAAKIDAIFGPTKRFKADFKQKYTAKMHGTTKNNSGVLWVQKPGKISLKYAKPNKNRAVSDGTVLKVYEHDNQQMFLRQVKNTDYPGAFAFILGKGLRSSFTFTLNERSKWEGGPVIVGTPRLPNPGYKKVLFYIDAELLRLGDLGAVRRVLVIDAQGNRNQFDFIQAVQPDSIPASEFIFEPPAGTEVIKG